MASLQSGLPNKKPRKHIESDTQIACVTWFKLQYPQYKILSIPNGAKLAGKTVKTSTGKMFNKQASLLKREGMLPGAADLLILVPTDLYPALFVEMKTDVGTQSEEQKEFQKYCQIQGYDYRVCRSLEKFIEIVNKYLKHK